MKQIFTIGEVLNYIESNYNNPKALVSYTNKGWKALSTREFIEQVQSVIHSLMQLGIKKGDKVGLLALPSAEWTVADYAIMGMGAISVPLFANLSSENFIFEIQQTSIKTVFVGGAEQWERVTHYADLFDHIIGIDDHECSDKSISYSDFLKKGKEGCGINYRDIILNIKPTDIATIIYTSGSTGRPKGAVHTHHSLTSLLPTSTYNWDNKKDSYLSFLPLAHVFARMINLISTSWGISTYYYNDVKNLGAICKEIRPTTLVVVPRLLEKIYNKMHSQVENSYWIKKAIGKFAFSLAHQKHPSLIKTLFFPLMDKLVYKHLREALGNNLRVIFCGGAPLNPHLYHFFLQVGFPIYEGWGLTESCPISANAPGKIKIGTVGTPIPGMFVKVNPEGELLSRGEMLMNKYYHVIEEKGAPNAIDSEGWLHTGDKGSIDSEGYITIIGRIKELFKTSIGEWVSPIPIEQELEKEPFIDTAIVIAENRKFASCLIIPEFETISHLKRKYGVESISDEEFLKSQSIRQEMRRTLDKVNAKLNEWSQIKDYRFIPKPLSIEEGELTPSMKVKRDVIEKKYKGLIDSMYQE